MIAHIRDSGGLHGAEQVILALGRNIDMRFQVLLICLRSADGKSDRLMELAGEAGYQVVPVAVEGRLDFRALSRIRKTFVDYGVRIVHSHDTKSNLYGLLASLGLNIRKVTTAHGTTRDSFWKKSYLFLNEKVIYRYFDAIIAVSDEIRTQLERKHSGKGTIRVIENGIDPLLVGLRSGGTEVVAPLPISENRKVFAVVGRLFPDKGHRFFLQAISGIVRSYPDVLGLVIGDGPAREAIALQVRELGLESHVFLCGERTDMKNVYENVDFLVIPSLTEGIPYVLLEAMIHRVPVLATNVGGIPGLIRHGVTGYLVPPGDSESLEKGMGDLLKNPEKSRQLSENGYHLVTEKYSAKEMARRMENIYDALIEE